MGMRSSLKEEKEIVGVPSRMKKEAASSCQEVQGPDQESAEKERLEGGGVGELPRRENVMAALTINSSSPHSLVYSSKSRTIALFFSGWKIESQKRSRCAIS
jgi:hypothetical protein